MRFTMIAQIAINANVDVDQVDEALLMYENASCWEQKVAITNSLILSMKLSNEARLKAKFEILFHLMRRTSVGDQKIITICYGNKAKSMLDIIETANDSNDIYDQCSGLFEHYDDRTYLSDVIRNIHAKEAIFAIYKRYGFKILSVMIKAHEQSNLDAFLMAFNEWSFNAGSIDLDQIELFILHLNTF